MSILYLFDTLCLVSAFFLVEVLEQRNVRMLISLIYLNSYKWSKSRYSLDRELRSDIPV